jgi:cytochrome c oxidase subunit 1
VLFLLVVVRTWMESGSGTATPVTLPAPLSGSEHSPPVLDNLKLWTAIAVVLVIFAYTLPLVAIVQDSGLLGEGIRAFPAVIDPILGVVP